MSVSQTFNNSTESLQF